MEISDNPNDSINHILVVDDEPDIREALKLYLSHMDYTVYAAENGERALDLLRLKAPGIVLSDIKMPGMDGIELLQEIKTVSPETEVIMITGHGDMDVAIQCLQLDATDFITKPINDDALDIALKRAKEKIILRRQLKEYTENLEKLVEEKSAQLIEAERLAAVGQAVLGLSTAMQDIAGGIQYFNEMPCFVSIHDRNLKVVASNQLYNERLGNPVGGNSWAIYKGSGGQSETCPAHTTFESGSPQRNKQIILYADGSELPVMVHTAPVRNRNGDIELVLEISADISEVQRLQEELRTSQQRYQQLFDEVPCYISVQDKNYRITDTNRRYKEDFGDAVGSQCYENFAHRAQPCDDCPVVKTFSDGGSHQTEMVVTSKLGKQINVLVWSAPIRNAMGEITHVMEMSTNITQLRELQDNLTTLGFLISSVSHGIKGILTGIDAGVYLMESGLSKQKTDSVQEGLNVLKLMVDRIRSLVLNVLFYAKNRELKKETVDVQKFASDIAFIMEPKAKKQDVVFALDCEGQLGGMEIDETVVRSALINILENAVEACAADSKKKTHRITFRIRRKADQIAFDIQDNGTGMNRETKENMFNLFFSSKGHEGTGLGLFIANKIVQQHGGNITVDTEPDQGTHFSIILPVQPPNNTEHLAVGGENGEIDLSKTLSD